MKLSVLIKQEGRLKAGNRAAVTTEALSEIPPKKGLGNYSC